MSVQSFIQAMPKVELHIHLEGAMQRSTLLTIAEQNEINVTLKNFQDWVNLLDNPDFQRLDEIARTVSQWLLHPDDLTRMVYELGVHLSKQNVQYAEISVNPTLYTDNGMSFEQFLAAINDGRERAERAWGIRMAWILVIPRDQPRKADDITRWAMSASARKGQIAAIGLSGREDAQPVGQFERAFVTAEKKGLARVIHAGDVFGAEGILEVLHTLLPDRVVDCWEAADSPDILNYLVEKRIPLEICIARALCLGWVQTYADYPLRRLYDEGLLVTIGSDMPSFYKSSLSDEYFAIVEHCNFSVDELEELALNAVRATLLPEEDKAAMLAKFTDEYARLRQEHIAPQTTSS